ncbi:cellulose binding domain-containing protein [Lentzea aerocolonigenes]|uniref:cellulose binding domain-containing protein n=1 Tax=Lentzea aerocolonigenes TaxID=68170 RepID=UPI000696C6A7|nr:cellulose binding domain-containing protein [Lentzea aerocolonigenes]
MRPLHHRPILYTPFAVLLAAACTTSAVENTAGSSQLTTTPPHGVTVLPPPPETVDEVVDGRTVALSNGLKARVLGLAAPGECWQEGAVKFAKDTLLGKPVRYSRASEAAITLRLANTPDQTDYATLAVSKGVVRAEKDDPVLTEPEKVAQKAGLGLWGPPCQGQDTTPAPAPPPPPSPPAPTTTPPPAQKDCSVSYRVAKTWADGFHVELIVRNTTRKPFEQWNLEWRFPSGQRIRETWGMTAYQYGADVRAISQDGGSIPAGGQVSLRFNAGTSGPNVQPKAFTLSGKECSVG